MGAFLIDPKNVSGQNALITGDEHHHLAHSVRARVGESILLSDGQGTLYEGIIDQITAKMTKIRLTDKRTVKQESPVEISLAIALIKSKNFDLVLQKAVELGVSEICPFFCARSVSEPSSPAAKTERWMRIINRAAMQCERAFIPTLKETSSLETIFQAASDFDLALLLAERINGLDWQVIVSGKFDRVQLIVGPEGGFTPKELEQAQSANLRSMSLGPRILRSETAAIAAVALLQHRLGNLK